MRKEGNLRMHLDQISTVSLWSLWMAMVMSSKIGKFDNHSSDSQFHRQQICSKFIGSTASLARSRGQDPSRSKQRCSHLTCARLWTPRPKQSTYVVSCVSWRQSGGPWELNHLNHLNHSKQLWQHLEMRWKQEGSQHTMQHDESMESGDRLGRVPPMTSESCIEVLCVCECMYDM